MNDWKDENDWQKAYYEAMERAKKIMYTKGGILSSDWEIKSAYNKPSSAGEPVERGDLWVLSVWDEAEVLINEMF